MVDMYNINDISDLWAHYGGQTAMARRFGVSQPAVAMWRDRGIPPGWYMLIWLDCKSKGVSINPSLFGLDDHPAAGLLNHTPPAG